MKGRKGKQIVQSEAVSVCSGVENLTKQDQVAERKFSFDQIDREGETQHDSSLVKESQSPKSTTKTKYTKEKDESQ